ncbi:hypothetical protein [Bizionia arctica]|uniref:Uncharacterized protein n=1 Tax=Bizionia arctica TaxID=1495645 RepID=A0A917GBN9_9FLAO|nr:hypothetical protein [Bizionia arctica]GGG36057.1 hypothetical protein GCM10010976_04690 [Bizionia arctica]
MKKLSLIFILGLFYSCQIQYDVSTRFVFEGQVNDRDGNPIDNNAVEAWIYNSNDSDLIGFTTTNADGNFTLIIPEPINENEFALKIKGGSVYSQKEYVNIWQSDFINYKLNLGEVTLIKGDDISQLQITLNHVTAENSISFIEVTGIMADQIVWVNSFENDYPYYYNYDTYYRDVAKNQTLNLYYEVSNVITGQTESFSESIVVESDNVTPYTLNY